MKAKTAPEVSIIIPCYRSEHLLPRGIADLREVLRFSGLAYEIICVDDGSPDEGWEVLQGLRSATLSVLRHEKNQGRGRAVADGIRNAEGGIVGFIDIDMETPAYCILPLINAVRSGAEVACGWRVYRLSWGSFHRHILSRGYAFLVRRLLGLPFRDTETGLKFFRREAILPLLDEIHAGGWFWDTEVMARSFAKGLKVVEIPVPFIRRRETGSTVRVVRDVIYYLRSLMRYRKGRRQGG